MVNKGMSKKEKKNVFFDRIYNTLPKYTKALLVDCNFIAAKQIHTVRKELRALDSEVLMGKNTLIRAAIESRLRKPEPSDRGYDEKIKDWTEVPQWEKLPAMLTGNKGIIFTNGDLTDIKAIMERHTRQAPARVGSIAQDDVVIQPGSTGLDPKQTGFFQNLNIQTKIVKSMIEIVTPTKVISQGEIVLQGQADLLHKLNIMPFKYYLTATDVLDNGKVINPRVLSIKPEDILAKYRVALNNVTAVGLATGVPNKGSARQSIINAFRNLVGVTYETEYTFKQADALKNAAAAAPAAGGAPAAAAPAEPEKEEEPETVDMGGVFGDDDDDY